MADERWDEEQLDFDVAARVLAEPSEPVEPERDPGRALLRRAGRTAATTLPLLLIAGLGALNVSLVMNRPDEVTTSPRAVTALPGRESLAEAPGPDALGLRQRFATHNASPSAGKGRRSQQGDRALRGGLDLTKGAIFAGGAPASASKATHAAADPTPEQDGKGKSQPKQEPEVIPEPSAVMYRMWNSEAYDHYFTINEEEKDRLLNEGYRTYATEGIIFPTQEKGTYPIHTDDGIVGYAFGKRHENTVPLYFLRGPNGEGDLFTTSTDTKDRWQLRHGWDYLGVVGYIGKWGPP